MDETVKPAEVPPTDPGIVRVAHRLALVLVGVALIWMCVATGQVTFSLEIWKVVPGFLMLCGGLVAFAIATARDSLARPLHGSALLVLLGIHFALALFPSVLWSRGYDVLHLASLSLGQFCLVYLIIGLVRREYVLKLTVVFLFLLMSVTCVAGLLEFLGLVLWRINAKPAAISSFFFYPNIYGGFLTLVMPSALGALVLARRRLLRILVGLVLLLALANLFLTHSRASMLATALGLAGFVLLYRRIAGQLRPSFWLLALAAAAAAGLLVGLAVLVPALRTKLLQTLTGFNARQVPYGMAVRMWTRSPLTIILGNGLGSFKALSFVYKPPGYRALVADRGWDAVHCEYLELLVDGGMVSLLAFLAVCVLLFAAAYRLASDTRASPTLRTMCAAFTAGSFAFLVDSGLSTNSRVPFLAFFFYFLVGLSVACGQTADRQWGEASGAAAGSLPAGARGSKPGPRWLSVWGGDAPRVAAVLLGFVLSAAAIGAAVGLVLRLVSEVDLSLAERHSVQASEHLQYLERARAADPRGVYVWYLLSENYRLRGSYADFLGAAAEVEQRIPGFGEVLLSRGVAAIARGDYGLAAREIDRYLVRESYDARAEAYSVLARALAGDQAAAVRALQTLVEHDSVPHPEEPWPVVAGTGTSVVPVVTFPVDRDAVRFFTDARGPVIELGIRSIENILSQIMRDVAPALNVYLFRLHFVLGNIYYSFGLPVPALRHFAEAYTQLSWAGSAVEDRNPGEESVGLAVPARDQDAFAEVRERLRSLLLWGIADRRAARDTKGEIVYLQEYRKYYDDGEQIERLATLYRATLRLKALRTMRE